MGPKPFLVSRVMDVEGNGVGDVEESSLRSIDGEEKGSDPVP